MLHSRKRDAPLGNKEFSSSIEAANIKGSSIKTSSDMGKKGYDGQKGQVKRPNSIFKWTNLWMNLSTKFIGGIA